MFNLLLVNEAYPILAQLMKIDVCQSGLFTRKESVNRFVYLAASVGLKVDSKLSRNGLKYHFFKVLDFCLTVNLNQNFLYLFNFFMFAREL